MTTMNLLLDIKWGARSMAALYLSLFSGIVVALQYDAGHSYYSVSIIDTLVPFGGFWRSLHFYASQLFFLLLVMHFTAVLLKKSPPSLAVDWYRLIFSMAVVVLLLFTGYILRYDATGSSAGRIAENILLSVPYVGRSLDSLFFYIGADGLKRVYANHLVGLGLLWLALVWTHLRRYMVGWRQFPWLLVALITWSAIIPAPLEPDKLGVFHINGPWFFIGLQELLRHIPPLWAGIVWPASFLCCLLFLEPGNAWRRRAGLLGLAWLAIYGLLTIVGLT